MQYRSHKFGYFRVVYKGSAAANENSNKNATHSSTSPLLVQSYCLSHILYLDDDKGYNLHDIYANSNVGSEGGFKLYSVGWGRRMRYSRRKKPKQQITFLSLVLLLGHPPLPPPYTSTHILPQLLITPTYLLLGLCYGNFFNNDSNLEILMCSTKIIWDTNKYMGFKSNYYPIQVTNLKNWKVQHFQRII